jgi:hypothetical protein
MNHIQVNLSITAVIDGTERIYVISQEESDELLLSIRGSESNGNKDAIEIAISDVFEIVARMLWFDIYPATLADLFESRLIESALNAQKKYGTIPSDVSVDLTVGVSGEEGTRTYSVSRTDGIHYSCHGNRTSIPIGMGHIPCVVCVLLNMGATPNVPVEPKEATDACRAKMT